MTVSTKASMEVLHAALVEAQKRLSKGSNGASTVIGNKEGIKKLGVNKAGIDSNMSALINSAALVMIRDRIEFTHAFVESLNVSQYPPKSTFVFIAREIVVNAPSDFLGGVFFGDNHLIFMADVMDLRHGVWVINDTIAPLETQGAPGGDVRIVCRDLLGATVISMAGTGGPGKDGKDGADGPKECEFHEDIGIVICEFGPGQNGGNGKDGAKGGNAGKITLSYVRDLVPGGFQPFPLQSFPGAGGQGGAKGIGGAGDPPGNDGVGGKQGPDGDINAPVVNVISEATYWAQVREQLGGSLANWRELRLRSADYHFRAFRPTPDKSNYLNLARDEAAAVMQLLPTPAEALEANLIRTQFEQQVNVLGLERNRTLVRYDYGYIHPNDEAAYLDGKLSHFDFQQRVRASMSVLESLEYDDAYDFYREERATIIKPGAIFTYPRPERADEQAATIKSLQETKRFFFAITPNDLRPSRHEAKVTNLSLTLEGVNTVVNSFGIIIEHSGRSQQRWLPSAQANPPLAEQILLPSTDIIEMKAQGNGKFFGKALVTLPGENQNILLQCAGRGQPPIGQSAWKKAPAPLISPNCQVSPLKSSMNLSLKAAKPTRPRLTPLRMRRVRSTLARPRWRWSS